MVAKLIEGKGRPQWDKNLNLHLGHHHHPAFPLSAMTLRTSKEHITIMRTESIGSVTVSDVLKLEC